MHLYWYRDVDGELTGIVAEFEKFILVGQRSLTCEIPAEKFEITGGSLTYRKIA
jgi:hypothetical protein